MSITSDLQNVRVRLEPGTLAQLQERAKANERSLAAEIRYIVKAYLERVDEANKGEQ